MVEIARRARAETGLGRVALSGGVWQNVVLLELTLTGLERAGFEGVLHRRVPANDGGLALGQAVVAALSRDG
jgi:hydrogenase maturation protein HypF